MTSNYITKSLEFTYVLSPQQHHCWKCGNIYCTRCIDRYMPLPGHESKRPVPVCKACFKELKNSPSPSIDDFQKLQAELAAGNRNS